MKRYEIIELLENLEGVKPINGTYLANLKADDLETTIKQLGFTELKVDRIFVPEDRYRHKIIKKYINAEKSLEISLQIHRRSDDEKITFRLRNTPDFVDRIAQLAASGDLYRR